MRSKLTNIASFFLFLGALFFANNTALAQVRIQVILNPPYTPYVANYLNLQNVGLLTLQNTTNGILQVKLKGRIDDGSGTFVKTKDGYRPLSAITLLPNQTKTLLGSELAFFNRTNTETNAPTALQNSIIKDGILPEGNYTFCVQALDFTTDAPLSPAVPSGCVNFQIGYLSPPNITAPQCGSSVINLPFSFQWTRPTGNLSGGNLQYDLYIVKMTSGQNPNEVIRGAIASNIGSPFVKRNLTIPTYFYLPVDPVLEFGATYAWAVKARDANNKLFFENNGLTEVCTFTYNFKVGISIMSAIKTNAVPLFPMTNDTVPFTQMPIVVGLTPESPNPDYYSFEFHATNIKNTEGSLLYQAPTPAIDSWEFGPLLNLKPFIPDITQAQAIQLPLNMRGTYPTFERGKSYNWESIVFIGQKGSGARGSGGPLSLPINVNVKGINIGMPEPKLALPAFDATVPAGSVKLTFSPGNKPQKSLPKYYLTYIGGGGSKPADISPVKERYVLEVATDAAFTTLIDVKSELIEFNPQSKVTKHEYDVSAFEAAVYKNIEVNTVNISEAGTYYWRVVYLRNPDASFTVADPPKLADWYRISPVSRFKIGGVPPIVVGCDGVVAPLSLSGDCAASCRIEIPTNKALLPCALKVGENIRIGNFDLNITESTGENGTYSGKGTIKVDFMFNVKVKVTFTNIKVNTAKQIFEGTVTADQDNLSLMSPTELALGGGAIRALSLSPAYLDAYDLALHQGIRLVHQLAGGTTGMPIGINKRVDNHDYNVGIISMTFTPQKATCDALLVIQIPPFPGATTSNFPTFGAKDVCFGPKGFNAEAKLFLADNLDLTDNNPNSYKVSLLGGRSLPSGAPKDAFTYVEIDCSGFKCVNVAGQVVFPQSVLKQDIAATGLTGPNDVKGVFQMKACRSWNFVAEVTMDNFQAASEPGWGFLGASDNKIKVYLDLSDTENPLGMKFPEGYAASSDARTVNTWQGFYMATAMIKTPKSLIYPNIRTTLASVQYLIIDKKGVTFKVESNDIINTEGAGVASVNNLQGWYFKMKNAYLEFYQNGFRKMGFSGEMGMPIMEKGSYMEYSANLSKTGSNYTCNVNVRPKDNIILPLFVANALLDNTSYINILVGSSSRLDANLSGHISISSVVAKELGKLPGSFTMPSVKFQDLLLNSDNGISIGACSLASPQKSVSGFPIQFDPTPGKDLKFSLNGTDPSVSLTPHLVLAGGEGKVAISASATIIFKSHLDIGGDGIKSINLKSVDFGGAEIHAEIKPVKLDGTLKFTKTDTKEELRATIKVGIDLGVSTVGGDMAIVFGTIHTDKTITVINQSEKYYNYWYVAGNVKFPDPGIAVAGFLSIYGLGGGVYSNMKQAAADLPIGDLAGASAVPYVESYGTHGFKFMAEIGDPSKTFYADAAFEAMFGTATSVTFKGKIYIMPSKEKPRTAPVWGELNMGYYTDGGTNNFFHAAFDMYLKIGMGDNMGIYGVGANNKMVSADLFAGKLDGVTTNHFWLGSPYDNTAFTSKLYAHTGIGPCGVKVVLPVLGEVARATGYLMIGDGLPQTIPPPPADFMALMGQGSGSLKDGKRDVNYEGSIDAGSINGKPIEGAKVFDPKSTASGFAMGIGAKMKLGFAIMPVYAELDVYAGFDINITNGNTAMCLDKTNNSVTPLGTNGWYGTGQVYAGLKGSIGLYVDIVIFQGKLELLGASVAAMLRGGLPNPTWAEGRLNIKYNFLGLVQGSVPFQARIGEKCDAIPGNPFDNIKIIQDLQPTGTNESVYTLPKAAFSIPVFKDSEFHYGEAIMEIPVYNADGKPEAPRMIKPYIAEFTLKNKDRNQAVLSSGIKMGDDNFSATLSRNDGLAARTNYLCSLRVKAKEFIPKSGITGDVRSEDLQIYEYRDETVKGVVRKVPTGVKRTWAGEGASVTFKTGDYPPNIPEDYVAYTYPLKRQNFCFKGENWGHGIMKFDLINGQGQGGNDNLRDSKSDYFVRFKPLPEGSGAEIKVPFTNQGSHLDFNISGLKNDQLYLMQFVREVKPTEWDLRLEAIASNAKMDLAFYAYKPLNMNNGQGATLKADVNKIRVDSKVLADETQNSRETILYKDFFKTSKFNTLKEKMDGLNWSDAVKENDEGFRAWQGFDVYLNYKLHTKTTLKEPFEDYDYNGFRKGNNLSQDIVLKPLVKFETIKEEPWHSGEWEGGGESFSQGYPYGPDPTFRDDKLVQLQKFFNQLGQFGCWGNKFIEDFRACYVSRSVGVTYSEFPRFTSVSDLFIPDPHPVCSICNEDFKIEPFQSSLSIANPITPQSAWMNPLADEALSDILNGPSPTSGSGQIRLRFAFDYNTMNIYNRSAKAADKFFNHVSTQYYKVADMEHKLTVPLRNYGWGGSELETDDWNQLKRVCTRIWGTSNHNTEEWVTANNILLLNSAYSLKYEGNSWIYNGRGFNFSMRYSEFLKKQGLNTAIIFGPNYQNNFLNYPNGFYHFVTEFGLRHPDGSSNMVGAGTFKVHEYKYGTPSAYYYNPRR
jgi:hypothetical protein